MRLMRCKEMRLMRCKVVLLLPPPPLQLKRRALHMHWISESILYLTKTLALASVNITTCRFKILRLCEFNPPANRSHF
jgi:hypothetical protein